MGDIACKNAGGADVRLQKGLPLRGDQHAVDNAERRDEGGLADAGDFDQVFNAGERAVLLPVVDNCLRQAWPDARQRVELLKGACVNVDQAAGGL